MVGRFRYTQVATEIICPICNRIRRFGKYVPISKDEYREMMVNGVKFVKRDCAQCRDADNLFI